DLARLSWSLARLDCAGAAAATACRVLGPRALPRVVEFDPPDLARLASALCRLGDVEGAWQLYARAQRALPGASGSQDLRGAMLGASERCNNLTRSLSVLAHLAIFPRVSRSPTWRLSLTVVATLLVWRRRSFGEAARRPSGRSRLRSLCFSTASGCCLCGCAAAAASCPGRGGGGEEDRPGSRGDGRPACFGYCRALRAARPYSRQAQGVRTAAAHRQLRLPLGRSRRASGGGGLCDTPDLPETGGRREATAAGARSLRGSGRPRRGAGHLRGLLCGRAGPGARGQAPA
ncbi:unnamed protein product, partial [Polarella glacialis]